MSTDDTIAARRGSGSNDLLGQASEARWYCLDRDGVAMLCKDEEDARAQVAESDDCWPGRAPHRAALLGDVAENYSADAERFRWLAEHTVATGLARWVHPFQFLAEAVDARRKEAATDAAPRLTTAAELRQQAKSDTSCVGAFARARPGKA